MKKITLLTFIMMITFSVSSQITLVKDIVTSDGDAWANNFLEGNNFAVFSFSGNNGAQVWATDGTEAGTVNIGTNIADIFNVYQTSAVVGNTLFFVIENGVTGAELYKTDGTEAGTTLVKDINPNFGSNPENLTAFNGELFFTADDGAVGVQLWKTDGTEAGTVAVSTSVKFPSSLTVFNGAIYFQGEDDMFDLELWKSDGTEAGTVRIKDIESTDSSFPSNLTIFNGSLFFTATTVASSTELWKTDGTEEGTIIVKDINPGVNNSSIDNLYVTNNNLLFTADNGTNGSEVWKTDGTEAGTVMVKDISTGGDSTSINGFLAFNATTTFIIAQTTDFGAEVWKTDGTEAGTVILKDINPGVDSGFSQFSPVKPLIHNGIIYFEADNGTNGSELWKSDGTEAGTVMVKDINSDNSVENGKGLFDGIILVDNKIIFEAFNADTNRELWTTDGTEAGTVILKDLNPGRGWGTSIGEAIIINNTLLFNGNNGNNGFELWKTDGTAAGTIMLKNLNNLPNGSNPEKFSVALNKIYIKADSTSFSNSRLFATDGTTADWVIDNVNGPILAPKAIIEYNGKVLLSSSDIVEDYGILSVDAQNSKTLVKKINPGGFSNITSFFHYQNTDELFFSADDGINGKELWKTNGTNAGTVLVKDLKAGADDSFISDFFEYNNNMYFITTVETFGFPKNYSKSLWKSDGTEAGTILLKEFSFISSNVQPYFTVYKNKLYFSAFDNSTGGFHLWRTDGTVAGTEAAYVGFDFPKNMIVIGETMFLAAGSNAEGQEMWKYDGTDAELFKSFSAGASDGYFPFNTFAKLVNGNLYFQVTDNNVNSLWKSDGTLAGTIKLFENFNFINEVEVAGDIFYLSLDDNINGTELWRTDGTEIGTIMVEDLYPGVDDFGTINSSIPSNLTVLGDDLYFSANTADYGLELFKLSNAVLNIEKEFSSSLNVKMNVFPNPATTKVTISLEGNQQIQKVELYSIIGQKVIEKRFENQSLIDVKTANLSKGMYLIKIYSEGKITSKKLIIK